MGTSWHGGRIAPGSRYLLGMRPRLSLRRSGGEGRCESVVGPDLAGLDVDLHLLPSGREAS